MRSARDEMRLDMMAQEIDVTACYICVYEVRYLPLNQNLPQILTTTAANAAANLTTTMKMFAVMTATAITAFDLPPFTAHSPPLDGEKLQKESEQSSHRRTG